MPPSLLTCLLLLPLAAPSAVPQQKPVKPPPAQPAATLPSREELNAKLSTQLLELARWCGKSGLTRERDRVYTELLHFTPDDPEARRYLQYTRAKDGTWSRSSSYREPKNSEDKALEEYAQRRRALLDPYRAAILQLARASTKDGHGSSERLEALRDLSEMLPDDPDVRQALGEVQVKGVWTLVETVEGPKRAKLLFDTAERALANAPKPAEAKPNKDELALKLNFTKVLATPHVRVLGTVGPAEIEDAVSTSEAAAELYRVALGSTLEHPEGFGILLLDPQFKTALLERHPKITADVRSFAAQLEGVWIPETMMVGIWSPVPVRRREWVSRHTTSSLLVCDFKLSLKQGALWEGLGLYLGTTLVGTHSTWHVQPALYVHENKDLLRVKLADPGTDWMAEAKTLMAGETAPKLGPLLRLDVNKLTPEDMLAAYAFAGYLLEGRACSQTREFLTLMGKNTPPEDAASAFGLDLATLERRFRRWVAERPE
jgi:hypothetical protein